MAACLQGGRRPERRLRAASIALWLVVCAAALSATGCERGPAVIFAGDAGVRVRVEVVDDPAERAHGLMYRRELAPDAGMLFVFPRQQILRFWMKNTFIPLDMIFLDDGRRVVGVVADTRPMSTASVGVDVPARFVLEVNAGFAARHGIRAGVEARFSGVPDDPR